MSDVVVTCPQRLWDDWIDEGVLPGEDDGGMEFHFWFWGLVPKIERSERVYVVAWGKLRGYAPLVRLEQRCRIRPEAHCLVRRAGAVAVTIPDPIRGFRGWQYRFWKRGSEQPFDDWKTP